MADAESSDAPARGEDAKVVEEWRRLERQRIDEEIAEAREDAGSGAGGRPGPRWLTWVAFVVAFVAGVVVTVVINQLFDFGQ